MLRRSVLAAACGFVIAASAHLLFVALRRAGRPAALDRLGVSRHLQRPRRHRRQAQRARRLRAEAVLVLPGAALPRSFLPLPLVLFGLPALLRRAHAHALGALAMAFGACIGVVVLSVPAVKEPLYVLSVAPLLYVLAGVCLAELDSDTRTSIDPANTAVVQAVTGAGRAQRGCACGSAHLVGVAGADRALRVAAHAPACWRAASRCGVGITPSASSRARCSRAARSPWACSRRCEHACPPARASARSLQRCARCWHERAPRIRASSRRRAEILMGYLQRAGSDWPAAPGAGANEAARRSARSDRRARGLRAFVFSPEQLAQPDLRRADRAARASSPRAALCRTSAEGYRVFASRAAVVRVPVSDRVGSGIRAARNSVSPAL